MRSHGQFDDLPTTVIGSPGSEANTMRNVAARSRILAVSLVVLVLAALLVLAIRAGNASEPRITVDLAPFKAMARAASCADIRNRLFLIDNQFVFWEGAGNCADASYSQILYGNTRDQVLCSRNDSIAGPMKTCRDARFRGMFDTLTKNLNKPDLGLGAEHTVQLVSF
jgi:hypothetical protein